MKLESQRQKIVKIRRDKSKTGVRKKSPNYGRACQFPSNQIADLREGTPQRALSDLNEASSDLPLFHHKEITRPSDIQFQRTKDQISEEDIVVLCGDDAEENCVFASGAREMRDCFLKLLQLVPLDDPAEHVHGHSLTAPPLCPVPPALNAGGRRISKLQLLQGAIDYILDLESTLDNRMDSLSGCCDPIGPLVFPLTNEERGLAPVLDSDLPRQVCGHKF